MTRTRIRPAGLLLVLLAMMAQFAAATVVPVPDVGLALGELSAICNAHSAEDTAPPQPDHHAPDCLLCPFCVSLTAPGIVLPSGIAALPSPQVVAFIPTGLPTATTPPVLPTNAAQPRGPPALI